MAWRARGRLWRELEGESGEELLVECGVAWFARRRWLGGRLGAHRSRPRASRPTRSIPPALSELPRRRRDLRAARAGGGRAAGWARRALVRQAEAHGARLVLAARGPSRGPRCSRTGPASTAMPSSGPAAPGSPASSASTSRYGSLEQLFFDAGPGWETPAWVDYDRAMYGSGDVDGLGVKACLDVEGPPLDPGARLPDSAASEPQVRAYLRDRFPALSRCAAPVPQGPVATSSPPTPTLWRRHARSSATSELVGGGSGPGRSTGPRWRNGSQARSSEPSRFRRPSLLGEQALEPADGRLRARQLSAGGKRSRIQSRPSGSRRAGAAHDRHVVAGPRVAELRSIG